MSAKCSSQNCSRKPDGSNDQNLCVLCFDWYKKCQAQAPQIHQQQNIANYQELVNIYDNLSNGVFVDQNQMMRAMIGSMINLMNQNSQITELKKENDRLAKNVNDLEEEVSTMKVKVFGLEYDFKEELERKNDVFSPADSIVIRNLAVPGDGDELKAVMKVLAKIDTEEFDAAKDIVKVERKGRQDDKLGSVFVKISDPQLKLEIMKKKKELKDKHEPELKQLKIMNYKTQEQIMLENALRSVLSVMPNGSRYELNGTMKLISKQ